MTNLRKPRTLRDFRELEDMHSWWLESGEIHETTRNGRPLFYAVRIPSDPSTRVEGRSRDIVARKLVKIAIS